jgi:hypothetical protein
MRIGDFDLEKDTIVRRINQIDEVFLDYQREVTDN